MWYEKFTFFNKQKGLEDKIPKNFFTSPTTEKVFEYISEYTNGKTKEDFQLPAILELPLEFIELLNYSNGGGIINGEREFGYFDLATIREMYMSYGFLIWAPNFLPIAFNGGGKFYTYKFNDTAENPLIYLVPSDCIGDDDSSVILGNTLEEVLSKTTNVEN